MIKVSKTNAIKAFVCTIMVLSLGFSTFGAPYGYAAETKPATTKEQSVQKKDAEKTDAKKDKLLEKISLLVEKQKAALSTLSKETIAKEKLEIDTKFSSKDPLEKIEKLIEKIEANLTKISQVSKKEDQPQKEKAEPKKETKKETSSNSKQEPKMKKITKTAVQGEDKSTENIKDIKNIHVPPALLYAPQFFGGTFHYSENLTTEKFIVSIADIAREVSQEHDIYASLLIACAILESNSGKAILAQAPNFNLFGVKDAEGKDKEFKSYLDSIDEFAKNMETTLFICKKSNTPDVYEACARFQDFSGVLIDANSLIELIDIYDLTRFDKPWEFLIKGDIEDFDKEKEEVFTRDLTMRDYICLESVAIDQLGKKYTWGGNNPEMSFDCSGLVQYVYKNALNVTLPRTTYEQQHEGAFVDFDSLRLGDLLFFDDEGDVGHVAMYLGSGYYIESTRADGIDGVRVTEMGVRPPSFAKRLCWLEDVEEKVDAKEEERSEDGL